MYNKYQSLLGLLGKIYKIYGRAFCILSAALVFR